MIRLHSMSGEPILANPHMIHTVTSCIDSSGVASSTVTFDGHAVYVRETVDDIHGLIRDFNKKYIVGGPLVGSGGQYRGGGGGGGGSYGGGGGGGGYGGG